MGVTVFLWPYCCNRLIYGIPSLRSKLAGWSLFEHDGSNIISLEAATSRNITDQPPYLVIFACYLLLRFRNPTVFQDPQILLQSKLFLGIFFLLPQNLYFFHMFYN